MHDMPTPSQLLEELAENAAVQIERNAPVAFDNALEEMSRYHRFLLQLNATTNTHGRSFNFSEISGSDWRAPHEEWIGHYRRLFERAANRIPDDNHFMRSLAYAPHKLLPGQDDLPISQEVTKGIIDLGPLMMHMIETWVSKKTEVRKNSGEDNIELRTMAGSNRSAYSDFLPYAISAWEYLLQKATYVYHWEEAKQSDMETQWEVFQESWPFIWQHLVNTARCLCIAVWNEDEIAATFFRESMARWQRNLSHDLGYGTGAVHVRLPYPDIMSLSWPEAKSHGMSLRTRLYQNLEAPEPRDLFAITVQGAFEDVLLLTSTVLLSWTSYQKQPTDIGARTASALLQRKTEEHQRPLARDSALCFRVLFLQAIRLNLAGARWEETTYGDILDRLIGLLDRMTERMVIPGRAFTPSTFDNRHELVLTIASILAANVPETGDDGLQQHVKHLAKAVDLLPDGDSSLRVVCDELKRIKSTLTAKSDELVRGTLGINPGCDTEVAFTRLLEIVEQVEATIDKIRAQRLRDTPVDVAKMKRIETAMEDALQDGDGYDLYFRDFEVQLHAQNIEATERIVQINDINKATLTNPPLEPPSSGFVNMLASIAKQRAGNYVWQAFTQLPRTQISFEVNVTDVEFWNSIQHMIDEVGNDPVLVVSQDCEGQNIRKLRYANAEDLPNLNIDYRQNVGPNDFYLATIEEVDVFSADIPAGTALLFSAQKLQRVRYSEIGDNGQCVEIRVELEDDSQGLLKARFLQHIEWSNGQVFEITTSSPDGEDGETQD